MSNVLSHAPLQGEYAAYTDLKLVNIVRNIKNRNTQKRPNNTSISGR